MQDNDIKRMILEQLMGEMDKGIGSKYKKPDALVIEKHTTAVPLGESDDKPMEAGDVKDMMGDADMSDDDEGDHEFRGPPMGIEAMKRRMGVKSKARGK